MGIQMRMALYIFLALFNCIAQAQEPVISFDNTHHNFGKILNDQKVSHRYRLLNKGTAPLQIREIRPACGCTSVVVGQRRLASGGEAFIEVQFNPKDLIGNVHKSVSVLSNDPKNPETLLTFEAGVMREIMPSATSLLFNDISRTGPAITKTIRLQSWNEQPVVVTDTKIPKASYLSCNPQQEGNDVVLHIAIDSKMLPIKSNRGTGNLVVYTTSKKEPMLNFEIQWEIQPVIIATPKRITWYDIAGKEIKTSLQLNHIEGKPFTILSAKSSSPYITASCLTNERSVEHKFDIVMSAMAKAGAYRELLVLELDDPEQPIMEIAIAAVLQ